MERTIRMALIALTALAIYGVVHAVTTAKFEKLAELLPTEESAVTAAERERQLDCLAINIYREAGYEPFEGKVAVAQVTMNRVEHPQFPNDVCAVVYEKNQWSGRVVCQFSWYCDSTHRNRRVGEKGYAESYEVAKRVLLEGFRLPSLEEAIFYHADYVNPRWRYERIQQIGTHIFYRPRNTNRSNDNA
jgi:spore germination cell wall hydrolase CwlJ-like protein